MRRTVQVAATDFRDRLRSRRLLIVAIAIVYLGYVVNTGQAELVFQADSPEPPGYTSYYGKRTAAYIGLSAGVVGAFVLFFAGFYLAQGCLQYDHTTNVDELLATTPISDAGYLIGKWLSAVGYLTVLLVVLWGATLVNHAIRSPAVA